jgi:hypothetical protein
MSSVTFTLKMPKDVAIKNRELLQLTVEERCWYLLKNLERVDVDVFEIQFTVTSDQVELVADIDLWILMMEEAQVEYDPLRLKTVQRSYREAIEKLDLIEKFLKQREEQK